MAMAAAPSGGTGIAVPSYKHKMIRRHEGYWPEVGKAGKPLAECIREVNGLASSHSTVMGHHTGQRKARDFDDSDVNLLLSRMNDIRTPVVEMSDRGALV